MLSGWIGSSLKDVAVILVVTGAGGSLGRMLAITKIGDYLGIALAQYSPSISLTLPDGFLILPAILSYEGIAHDHAR